MDERPQQSEPVFNAPWTVPALMAAIVASFFLQTRIADEGWLAYALFPVEVTRYGRWETLVASLFLHGGWLHALMNAAGVLAFGAPVARLFGRGPGGALGFFGFYLLCGVLAGLGFVMAHPQGMAPVVGASGAVSGLMGAAARLIERRGRLGPLLGRTPVGMSIAWVAVNLIFGLTTLTPGAGGAPIAWEAHLAGFFAGLLLVGPLARLLGKA